MRGGTVQINWHDTKPVLTLDFHPHSGLLATGGADKDIKLWKIDSGEVEKKVPTASYHNSLCYHGSAVNTLRFSLSGEQLASGADGGELIIWKLHSTETGQTWKVLKTLSFGDSTVGALNSFHVQSSWIHKHEFDPSSTGSYKFSPATEPINTAYVFSRKDLSRTTLLLPGASKPVVAVRFCPMKFSLRGSNHAPFFKLPYRLIFAVATLNSLYVYDTESVAPIAVLAGLHYAAITDIAWSPSAKYLALSSQHGYCTLVEFENGELGSPISSSEVGKFTANENKSEDMVIEAATNNNFVAVDNIKTEAERSEGTQGSPISTNTPVSNKPAKRRITPTAVSPP